MSGDEALSTALRRERAIALTALLVIATMAWLWLLREAQRMSGMDMSSMGGMRMSYLQMLSPAYAPWTWTLGTYLFCMWFVMMIGMMTPSAAPMVLLYLGVSRHAVRTGHRFTSAGWFFGGYLIAWAAFSLIATLAHWWLESVALMTPMMRTASRPLGATVLIAAGIYQWLPLKDACLAQCRAPLSFIQQHGGFRPEPTAALRLGFTHGWYCVGCCWVLMLLLLVGGVMNLLWIASLAAFVLIEKLAPGGRWISRAAGVVAIAAGLWMLRG